MSKALIAYFVIGGGCIYIKGPDILSLQHLTELNLGDQKISTLVVG